MNRWGGKRFGAGRKKGHLSIEQEALNEARDNLVRRILNDWVPISETMLRSALGEYYVEKYKDGKRYIYKKQPDWRCLLDLVEIVIGKPKLNIDSAINLPAIDDLSTNIKKILEQ